MGLNVVGPAFSGTALRCSYGTGGCATRPAGSNMLAIPWPQARGRPAPPCAPPTPTRRPPRGPLNPFPSRSWRCHISRSGCSHICASRTTASQAKRSNGSAASRGGRSTGSGASKGWAGVWPGALLAPSSAAARWACAQRMLRELTGRSCLSAAAKPRSEFCGPTLPRAAQGSHAAGVTDNIEAQSAAPTSRAPRCPEKKHHNRHATAHGDLSKATMAAEAPSS